MDMSTKMLLITEKMCTCQSGMKWSLECGAGIRKAFKSLSIFHLVLTSLYLGSMMSQFIMLMTVNSRNESIKMHPQPLMQKVKSHP